MWSLLSSSLLYVAYYDKYADIQAASEGKFPYYDPKSLEECAEFLLSHMSCLQSWMHNVPSGLKTERKGVGEPYSTDRSSLDIDPLAPFWLQRQRLLLELLYHNLALNLHRLFIRLPPSSSSSKPFAEGNIAEGNAISCVNHAIAITRIIHQTITETYILSVWYEVFQWQWNASLFLIGFIMAYPMNSSTPSVRKTLDYAVRVSEAYGENFAMAESAAGVTRVLTAKADVLVNRFRSSLSTPSLDSFGNIDGLQICNGLDGSRTPGSNEGAMTPVEEPLSYSMDLAFFIDSSTFDLWGNGLEMWNFPGNLDSQLPPWPVNP